MCVHVDFVVTSACHTLSQYTDVAELVLNKCTEPDWSSEDKCNVQPCPESYKVNFNFKLLEDLQEKYVQTRTV